MPPITRSKALSKAPPASTTKPKPAPRKPNKPKPKPKSKSTKNPQSPKPAKISKPQTPPKKKSKSKKKPTNPKPKPKNKPPPAPRNPHTNTIPAEGEHDQHEEEDWELAESYRILPYLTSPDFMPPYLPSKGPSKRGTSNSRATPPARIHARQRTRQTTAGPPPTHPSSPIRSNHNSPRVPPTPPPSAAISPAVPDRRHLSVHFEDDEGSTLPPKRGQKLKRGSSSSESIKLADIPSYVPSAAGSTTPDSGEGYGLTDAVRNGWVPVLNASDVGMRGQNLPSSFPIEANPQTTQRSRRNPNPNPNPPSPTPSTPLSLPAAQVFKRPTVNTLRQERAQFHEALGVWVVSLEGVLDVLGGVVREVRGRMGVLQAVNRVQKPLMRAVLGRERGKGRGRRGR